MGIMDEIEEMANSDDDWCEFCFSETFEHDIDCPLNPEVNFIDEEYDFSIDCE